MNLFHSGSYSCGGVSPSGLCARFAYVLTAHVVFLVMVCGSAVMTYLHTHVTGRRNME